MLQLVVQCAELLPAIPAPLVTMLIGILTTPFPIQLPVNAHGKILEDDPSTWIPATCMETRRKFLAFGFALTQSQPLWAYKEGTSG